MGHHPLCTSREDITFVTDLNDDKFCAYLEHCGVFDPQGGGKDSRIK